MFESIKIYKDVKLDLEKILRKLDSFGYKRNDQIGQQGDYCVRGGILDIFLIGFDDPIRIELYNTKVESIRSFDLITSDIVSEHNMVILIPIRGISPRKLKARLFEYTDEMPINNFVDIEPGDLIVHIEYGIGKYLGIEKLKVDKKYTDHIVLEYADADRLILPIDEMHLIQKYIGFEGRPPKLYKLGSKLWKKVKESTREGVHSLARELLEFQAKRAAIPGFAFSKDIDWQGQLEGDFPYQETPDQTRCSNEVKQDMELSRPMDRLLCGDVGYGKTEVALRAAFKAVMSGKQVALLVPTTILAEQHYSTFVKRLENFPVNVRMLSRFRSAGVQKEIIEGVKKGSVDIVIGTHRLLSGDVKFKDLGLVIIDEEQRFGVRHKERLKRIRFSVDVLTMTATPIPRTLYMSLMGARDMSVLNTPPPDRLPIKTKVSTYSDQVVKEAVRREINRGGQVFFVHNRVNDIDSIALRLKAIFPDLKIDIGHGQMCSSELEKVMIDFIEGKTDMLVSTNIIESGIDIPNANTILINRADRFGLADLYQLRGRVGRFKREAYAYLLVPKKSILDTPAKKRLKAAAKFTALGSGFKIAMEDLQLRGAGNLLGPQQHGFIMAVGFDLYCRLLKQAVGSLKA